MIPYCIVMVIHLLLVLTFNIIIINITLLILGHTLVSKYNFTLSYPIKNVITDSSLYKMIKTKISTQYHESVDFKTIDLRLIPLNIKNWYLCKCLMSANKNMYTSLLQYMVWK